MSWWGCRGLSWTGVCLVFGHGSTTVRRPPSTPGLDGFYRRAGFTVQEYGRPLDLSVMFGMSALISPGEGERIFRRDRPRGS
jgi:hypothetical protein